MIDLGWVTIPTEEFERLHDDIRLLRTGVAMREEFIARLQVELDKCNERASFPEV